MLGRAKWDAWSQRSGMGSLEAKQLYVESMMRTLRKFKDRREARELIDELETFSGQVAERVMRGSLEDTESEMESGSVSASDGQQQEEEEQQQSQWRRREEQQRGPSRRQQPHHQAALNPSSRQASAGSLTPQMSRGRGHPPGTMESIASRSESESDVSDEEDAYPRRPQPPIASTSQQAMGRMPPPRSTTGQGMYYGGGGGRPPPPRSDSQMGGGAGASLYSAIAPSRPPPSAGGGYGHGPGPRRPPSTVGTGAGGAPGGGGGGGPVEHHYYHRASEAGGRPPSSTGRRGPGAASPAVDEALQSIQASLAALHERMNRVESSSSSSSPNNGRRGSTRGIILSGAYEAVWNALHDVANLIGLTSGSSSSAAAPSFGASHQQQGAGAGSRQPSRVRMTFNVILALVNLALRLTLDLTSLGILLTVVLFAVKRLTGRGDPLVLMRLVRSVMGRRAERTGAALVAGAISGAANGSNGNAVGNSSGGGNRSQ